MSMLCLLLPLLAGGVAARADDGPESPIRLDQASAYFETHIRPLFARHCYACHSEQADERQGDLSLDRQSGWMRGGERGAAIVPGDPAASLLMQAVNYAEPDLEMPPSHRLPATDIRRLEHWIRLGAPGPAHDEPLTIDDPADPLAGKSHWAFQKLQVVAPPPVQDKDWPRHPIDNFILARLEQQGLRPAADAPPKTVLRRTSFQLNGLPPSFDISEEFLRAPSSATMGRLVDRLMASPQFGQRWGRHWLDLARYADSNGLDENFLFREAWRYRNWVIDASNADLAFDDFLTQQLAGDLLPFDTLEQRDRQRIAAGFLVVGPKVLLGVNPEQQRMDIADEQVDSLGRAVLAQTLGCARCHDHKFDPIPTADYYALAGIFTSTVVMENRYMLGQQRLMEQLIGLGPDGSQADAAYETYWREQPQRKKRKQQAEQALELLASMDNDALAAFAEQHSQAVAAAAVDAQRPHAERMAEQQALIASLNELEAKPPVIPPRAMVPADREKPADEAIRLAGQFDAKGSPVPRGFLTVLQAESEQAMALDQSGRLELARWLTDAHAPAGHLAARVLANRIWQHLMGRGLVRTVDNFGRTGEPPSHPELLDYLALELIESGWSIKHLVREIASSRSFSMSSAYSAEGDAIDPENRWLWRAHRRRLEPEALRDAMLFAAGGLDLAQFDSTVDYLGDQATAVGENKVRRRTDFACRSVYLPVIRNDLPEVFDAFDFTNPHVTTGARPQTMVPSQGLFMLNDELVMQAAERTARRLVTEFPDDSPAQRVDHMFELIVQDVPSVEQRSEILEFLQPLEWEDQEQAEAVHGRLVLACHALFASSRFQFVE